MGVVGRVVGGGYTGAEILLYKKILLAVFGAGDSDLLHERLSLVASVAYMGLYGGKRGRVFTCKR